MNDKQFYSIEEVANLFRLSVGTVRQLVRNGDIQAIRLGRTYRISSETLDYIRESKLVEVK